MDMIARQPRKPVQKLVLNICYPLNPDFQKSAMLSSTEGKQNQSENLQAS